LLRIDSSSQFSATTPWTDSCIEDHPFHSQCSCSAGLPFLSPRDSAGFCIGDLPSQRPCHSAVRCTGSHPSQSPQSCIGGHPYQSPYPWAVLAPNRSHRIKTKLTPPIRRGLLNTEHCSQAPIHFRIPRGLSGRTDRPSSMSSAGCCRESEDLMPFRSFLDLL